MTIGLQHMRAKSGSNKSYIHRRKNWITTTAGYPQNVRYPQFSEYLHL